MEKLTIAGLKEMFAVIAKTFEENCAYLCELDARMGDGDLGLTMKRGYAVAAETLASAQEGTIDKLLIKTGMKMSSVVPSTMGTLMSSGVISGGKAVGEKTEMGAAEFVIFLEGFCAGIVKRGKCAPGDRTILDALDKAREFAVKKLQETDSLESLAGAALEGAKLGVESTRMMYPKFGKAAVFAAKAIGVEDQGAIAGKLLIQAIKDYICT